MWECERRHENAEMKCQRRGSQQREFVLFLFGTIGKKENPIFVSEREREKANILFIKKNIEMSLKI